MQLRFNPASLNRTFDTSHGVTRIDIRPDPAVASPQPLTLFGAAGPGFRDLLDAINPLNHLPIVSNLFQEATGHKPSAGAKLLGGALVGGPIGFVASLASIIFEDATGSDPAQAVYAALVSDADANTPTQLAGHAPDAATQNNPAPQSLAQSLPPTGLQQVAAQSSVPPAQLAALLPDTRASILSSYSGVQPSAHASYKKAQLLPYLRDVTLHKQV